MLTIGEFSKISRVSAKTLRYYDEIGLFKPGYVSDFSGYRYYRVSQLRDILLISKLKQYQFTLPEIARILSKDDAAYLKEAINQKRIELQRQIREQESVLLQMEEDLKRIERCDSIMEINYLIKTVSFQPKTIFSLRRRMGVKDFPRAYGDLFAEMERNKVKPCGPLLTVYHDSEFNHDATDIEVGAEVPQDSACTVRKLDPGLCCFATHVGPYENFNQCYTALMEWIDREGYTISGPPFELYIKGYDDNVAPEEFVTEVYFPIKK
ncbi:MerR family transcriptional regulator [Caproiciproducens galactitolivorans]|uniref:MerR family transcriptional regulator n=1 Tax=Caproiciproducens galactitolivorans TaxID=642589 RepID=UPI0024092187|nr:MerR family transcriptional regulator [Caproiciproducens galactitolivorans]